MGKNKGRGGKNRKKGKQIDTKSKRELAFKEEDQEYAQVLRMLGNGRLEAYCFDGVKRFCHIRGKMRKKIWIANGDIVLVSLREFQDKKGDVVWKYQPEEVRSLKAYGEIPEHIAQEEGGATNQDVLVQFEDMSMSESESDGSDDSDDEEQGGGGRQYDMPSSSSSDYDSDGGNKKEYDELDDI